MDLARKRVAAPVAVTEPILYRKPNKSPEDWNPEKPYYVTHNIFTKQSLKDARHQRQLLEKNFKREYSVRL